MFKEIYQNIACFLSSDHTLQILMHKIFESFLFVWQYKIFETSDHHKVLTGNLVIAIILFFIGMRFARRVSAALKKKLISKSIDMSMASSLERVFYYILLLLVSLFVLDVSNVPLTAFAVVGTTLALGVGLGSQNIANNFMSGLIIMIERPIKLGDIIEIKNIVGMVTNIGSRCVTIQTDKNINMLIPNSQILQDSIVNWTLEDTILKSVFTLKVSNNSNLEELDAMILQNIISSPYILDFPKPSMFIKELYKEAYEIEVEFWVDLKSSQKHRYIMDVIYRNLIPMLKEKNIMIMNIH
jgi:potassium-dependent mechanosensitive channel